MPNTDPITEGDTALAVVYRLTDADGRIWRSAPYILADSQFWDSTITTASTHCDSFVRIPTLRHLMAGTVAEIELYFGQVDLQCFVVLPNDPTVFYVDYYPKHVNGGTWMGTPAAFGSLAEAVAFQGAGETLYTTGNALPNASPPISRCLYVWRNRVFVANENSVWPSLELEDGIGVRWSDITRFRWEDGTGDILAICHIDWNYLALFKRDAIGIVSGPGPDGLGAGNYIVQTLSTKAGCSNPKSIVNGADGVYYQDSQTGRLMLLSANLQVQEAVPGAFDFSAGTITAAVHVESLRQVWFYSAGATNQMIVLDYKHRAESCPLGSAYTWTLPSGWQVAGMVAMRSGPLLILSDGSTAKQIVGQAYDVDFAATQYPVAMAMLSADISPFGLQRQFNLCRVQALGEYVSGHDLRIDVYPNFGNRTTGTGQKGISSEPEQLSFRPPNCMRIQAVQIGVTEIPDDAPYLGAGLKFVGFALELQDFGKLVNLDVGGIV